MTAIEKTITTTAKDGGSVDHAGAIIDQLDIWSSAIQNKKGVGRGSSKKLNLYGIKKLRELILELAVRGLLVQQNSNDEPACELLKRLTNKKKLIAKSDKFTELKVKKNLKYDKLFKIPSSWEWCHLDDIAAIARGGSPRPIKSYITESEDGLNWIKIGDSVRGSRYITSTEQKIIKEGLVKTRQVYPGDLILSNSMSFGYPYILKISGCIHDGWLVIRTPEDDLNKLFLCNLFMSIYAKKAFTEAASGAVVQNLNSDKVKLLAIPLPPLAEQHRIVTKVDELMILCDQLEQQQENSITAHKILVETLLSALTNAADKGAFDQAWEKIANHFDTLFTTEHSIDQLKLTIQQLAIMGKLLRHDDSYESAEQLLKRLSFEKEELINNKIIKKSKNVESVNEKKVPFEVPDNWQWSRLDDIGQVFEYGTSTKAHEDPDGVPVLRMGNIQNGEIVYENLKYVDSDIDELPRLYLQYGDLVFNRTNSYALVGKMGVFDGADDSYTLASYLIRVKLFNKYIDSRFINMFFQTPVCRATQIEPEITVQTNQANFNGTKLKNILIPIAPLEEQKKIVEKVDELMILCDQLKANISKAKVIQFQLADAVAEHAVNE